MEQNIKENQKQEKRCDHVDRSPLEPSFQPPFSSFPRKSLSPAPLWLSIFFPIHLLLCFSPNPHLTMFFLLLFLTFSQNLHLLKASFPQSWKTPLSLFFASSHFLLILSRTSIPSKTLSLNFSLFPYFSSLASFYPLYCSPFSRKVSILNHHQGKVVMSFATRPIHIAPTKTVPHSNNMLSNSSQDGKKISYEMLSIKEKKNKWPLVYKKGLQICPSSVEFMSIRNMNTIVKRKYE